MTGLALGIELDGEGSHPASWRRAAHSPDKLLTGETVRRRVEAAENAGFTFATFDDSILPPKSDITSSDVIGRIDAVDRASFVAATTSKIGLVPVVGTTYAEPFHTSSQLATLDYSSAGRGGWIAVPVPEAAAARAWGRPPAADLDAEQRDSIDVARRLWDSWEDDAVIRDVASGRFLDRDRLHYIDFEGNSFTVKGPAIVPRPPQGQLVVFAPDAADTTSADVTLVSARSVDLLVERAAELRSGDRRLIMAEIGVALDTSSDKGVARRENLHKHTAAADTDWLEFSGSAGELVDLLTTLSKHVDGVRLRPLVIDEDLPQLSRYVVPALIRSGVANRPVPGSTLRSNLGLSRPANRYEGVRK